AYVEIRLMLAGKACSRQVLGDGGAAYGDAQLLPILLDQFAPGRADLLPQLLVLRRRIDDLPGLGPGPRQRPHIVLVEIVEKFVQPLPGACLGQDVPIGLCSGREAVRDVQAERRELPVELAERSVLAADQWYIVEIQFRKPVA